MHECVFRTLFPVPLRDNLGGQMFRLADVDPQARPFQLTVGEFGRLCKAYEKICQHDPRLFKYNARGSRKDFFDGEDGEQQDEQPLVAQDVCV
ncbi:hypothetical protein PR048_022137 [Dryococelus australis]|uniref:Uncharacterized protein n=1 Tax=Dryococelus australis TaxID=614101 RepID=A0ABQ9H068_9NEOP|nr:hypothetical protein PR048_022137 [Dryococelus australis]